MSVISDLQNRSYHVLPATEADIPALMSLEYAACDGDPFHLAIWGPDTAKSRDAAGRRLLAKWRNDPYLHVMKCVDIRGSSIMGFCLWDIFEKERSAAEIAGEDELQTCSWLTGRDRELARAYIIPAVEARREHMGGRPYALLTNLCTDPRWQRKGAANALTSWGLKRAEELGIPVLLEASEQGIGIYSRLGFEKVGMVKSYLDGKLLEEYPLMVKEASGRIEENGKKSPPAV